MQESCVWPAMRGARWIGCHLKACQIDWCNVVWILVNVIEMWDNPTITGSAHFERCGVLSLGSCGSGRRLCVFSVV